jgi:hypothetical protein
LLRTSRPHGTAAPTLSLADALMRGASITKGKRGGARPNTGPRAKFTILQEWVIGGQIHTGT